MDWWAFGVLTYEMLLGQSPFRGDDEDEIFDAILEDEPLYPITMPRDAVSLLQRVRSPIYSFSLRINHILAIDTRSCPPIGSRRIRRRRNQETPLLQRRLIRRRLSEADPTTLFPDDRECYGYE